MHILKSIEVHGFRGQLKIIRLALKPDANFIIGRNGTGKTTLINLIHAALALDTDVLKEIEFERIDLRFREKGSTRTPVVSVLRRLTEESGTHIEYKVRRSAREKDQHFRVTAPVRRSFVTHDGSRRLISTAPNRLGLRELLRNLYRMTWLSLQRRDTFEPEEFDDFEEEESGTDVDRKLDQVAVLLAGYFSRLDRQVAEQTQIFQKDWFLSFLAREQRSLNLRLSKVNFDEDREALIDIFDKFHLEPESYTEQLEKHFRLAKEVSKLDPSQGMSVRNFFIVYDVERLHSLVVQWQKLQNRQRDIYRPRTQFTSISSDLLYRIHVSINSSNMIIITSDADQNVPLRSLSSGEKQLLIFLSETLLQEQAPTLFLADEPELSLHVEWQEDLVPSILKINPNAQVLFATHSPDIVNVYQKNVLRMEDLIE